MNEASQVAHQENYDLFTALGFHKKANQIGRTHRAVVQGDMDLLIARVTDRVNEADGRRYQAYLMGHYYSAGGGTLRGDPEMVVTLFPDQRLLIPQRLVISIAENDLFAPDEREQPTLAEMTRYLNQWLQVLGQKGYGALWNT